MSKFNIIIAKRGRDKYLKACLYYLNKANENKRHDVKIYIMKDETELPFNKSKLLNKGLKKMRKDFDFISIIDVDICYREDFFDIIEKEVDDNTYFVSSGYKLDKKSIYLLDILPKWEHMFRYIDTNLKDENINRAYPSQITLSKTLYYKILDIIGEPLYNESFIGWGREDSVLSFFSREAEKLGILVKKINLNMWYHIWHEHQSEINIEENNSIFLRLIKVNKDKLNTWINTQK